MITVFTKHAAETRRIAFDLSSRFIGTELLTGTPTVTEVGTSDLTISGIEVPAAETVQRAGAWWWPFWRQPPYGRMVAFSVAGGTAGESYTLRVTAGTNATYPQTLIQDITLRVI